MSQATGYILRLSASRFALLREEMGVSGRFAEAVPSIAHPRKSPLVSFIVDEKGRTTHIAKSRRGVAAATGMSRLNLEDIHELDEPLILTGVAPDVAPRFRTSVVDRVGRGGLLTPKQFRALVAASLGSRRRPLCRRERRDGPCGCAPLPASTPTASAGQCSWRRQS